LANGIVEPRYGRAEVAEQADASVSKTDVRKDVRVRLPLSAPQRKPTMPMTIRAATEADQLMIRRLIKEANLYRMSLDWPNFVVAEEDGAIVGLGQVKAHRDGSRELASIAVVPARQGCGIGSAVVRTLLAQERGVLHLTCRRQMQGYYERFGFRRLMSSEFPPHFRRLVPIVNIFAPALGTEILVMRREARV
jgi:amino-acid N-acetyltransferase